MCGGDATGAATTGVLAITGTVVFGWLFLLAVVMVVGGFVLFRIAYRKRAVGATESTVRNELL
ncbi:hypothetical protein [Humidisolicoccus flavus]|uniref:hypothetical protein n=1 Tax=Humidisolicoccus flavus TaxID=3111414 RepID=UPI003251D56B